MIKMVAFDFDGTIADTITMCIESFKKLYHLMQDMSLQNQRSFKHLD